MERTVRIAAGIAIVSLLGLGGCNIAAPVYYGVVGPEKTDAIYKIDPNLSTVVFVDDPQGLLPSKSLRDDVARIAERDLLDQKVLTNVVDSRAATQAANADKLGKQLTITEIGRAASADIVIYVLIDEFTLSAGGQPYKPGASVSIKVIDTKTDKRLFPENKSGAKIIVDSHDKPGTPPTNRSEALIAAKELAQKVGLAVSQSFYRHESMYDAGSYNP